MSMSMGSMGVNMHAAALHPIFFAVVFVSATVDGVGVGVGEVSRRKSVDHQRNDRRHHRHEASEGKVPGFPFQTRRRQVLERVGEDVDEAGGEDDAGGEGFDYEEHVLLRPESRHCLSDDRDANSDRPRGEDRRNGGALVFEGLAFVPAFFIFRVARALRPG